MKKTLLMGLALIAFVHASVDGSQGEAQNKGSFARRLDRMQRADLNGMSNAELLAFQAHLDQEKMGDPYTAGRGSYKAMIDEWSAAVAAKLANPLHMEAVSTDIPMRKLPTNGNTVIDMFRVTEEQLLGNRAKAEQFYDELQLLKQTGPSYKQAGTKAKVDHWLGWLEDIMKFGDNAGKAVAAGTGADMDDTAAVRQTRGRSPARRDSDDVASRARSTSAERAERRRLEADRGDYQAQAQAQAPARRAASKSPSRD